MVNDLPRLSSVNGIARQDRPHGDSAAQIRAIAELGTRLLDGAGSLIAWHGTDDAGTIRAGSDSHLRSHLDSLFAAIERDQRYRSYRAHNRGGLLRWSNELAAASGRRLREGPYVAAAIWISVGEEPAASITAILIAPGAHPACDLGAAVELLARSTMNVLRTRSAACSREFWRERAADFATRLAGAEAEEANGLAARDQIERTATAAEGLRPRNRFVGLGALFAKLGMFDAWILGLIEDGVWRKMASAGVLEPTAIIGKPDSGVSALAESFRRKSTMVRLDLRAKHLRYSEDGIFAQHIAGYICVPFASGAIALAAHEKIDATTIKRIEAAARRLEPVIAIWQLEAETERLRRLVRNLGLRMFGAIDAERARIARDLHDHQAQLLAAARIGIEAGPDEARGIFKQLEDSLRLRVRELKPPTLGRSMLADGLRDELRRLADGGIRTRLLHADRMNALTRPIQQLCYQISREALANVVRHAHASRVEIGIEKHGSLVRLSILDNGTGIHDTNGRNGIGLDGLNERLALMGGRLRVESKTGATRLIAEIPEPA